MVRSHGYLTFLLLAQLSVASGSAQVLSTSARGGEAPHLPRVPAATLLHGGPPLTSFAELSAIVNPGLEVVVHQFGSRAARPGRVVAIDGETLTLRTRRSWFRHGNTTYPKEAIRRVDVVDRTVDGMAKGALAAVAVIGVVALRDRPSAESSMEGLATALAVLFVTPSALVIGQVSDRLDNAPIYLAGAVERQDAPPR